MQGARSSTAGVQDLTPLPNRIPFQGTAPLPARLVPAHSISVGCFRLQGKSRAIVLLLCSFLLHLAVVTAKQH